MWDRAMKLGLRQLRYFVAIAESGALSHAAQALSVAQSALSHHVAALEAALGVPLIERHARGIVLTPAGRRLCEHARAILAAVAKAEQDVRTLAQSASGTVSVGLTHTGTEAIALPLMRLVREQLPDVVLGITEALSGALVAKLVAGELDLALAYNPPDDARLTSEALLTEEMHLIGRLEIIGGTQAPIAFSDIPRQRILAPYPVGLSRAIVESAALRGQMGPDHVLEIDSGVAMRKALEDGLGCTILARASVPESLRAGRLASRRIIHPSLTRSLHVLALRDRPQTRAFLEVRQLLLDIVLAEVVAGRWEAKPAAASKRRPPSKNRIVRIA